MHKALILATFVSALAVICESRQIDYWSYPAYSLQTNVHDPVTLDIKSRWEKRDGDVVVGEYSLREPGGSIRVVKYRASDKTGFEAQVSRIGPQLLESGPPAKGPIV